MTRAPYPRCPATCRSGTPTYQVIGVEALSRSISQPTAGARTSALLDAVTAQCVEVPFHRHGFAPVRPRFPPLPDSCKGYGWVLKNTTAAAEALHGVSQVVPDVERSKIPSSTGSK